TATATGNAADAPATGGAAATPAGDATATATGDATATPAGDATAPGSAAATATGTTAPDASASPTPCPAQSDGANMAAAQRVPVTPDPFATGPIATQQLGGIANQPVDGTGEAINMNQTPNQAADSLNCTLTVPANPLTAQGLATPYQLGDGCSETVP